MLPVNGPRCEHGHMSIYIYCNQNLELHTHIGFTIAEAHCNRHSTRLHTDEPDNTVRTQCNDLLLAITGVYDVCAVPTQTKHRNHDFDG